LTAKLNSGDERTHGDDGGSGVHGIGLHQLDLGRELGAVFDDVAVDRGVAERTGGEEGRGAGGGLAVEEGLLLELDGCYSSWVVGRLAYREGRARGRNGEGSDVSREDAVRAATWKGESDMACKG
jgi:hypothetical protein